MVKILVAKGQAFLNFANTSLRLRIPFSRFQNVPNRTPAAERIGRNCEIHTLLNLEDDIHTILLNEKSHLTLVVEVCFGAVSDEGHNL